MNREPHSKYEHGIKKFEVRIYWDDQTEVLSKTLPDSILRELEQYVIDLEDLRAQDPDNYFGEAAEYAQLQMLADDLIAKYKHEIVKDRDWWYGTDDYSFNIHSPDEDGWFHVNVYKVDPVTGMDNYEWMIDLPRVYLGGQKEKDPLNQDAIEQEAIGHLNLANTIIYNLEGDKYQAIYEQLEEIIKQMKEAS